MRISDWSSDVCSSDLRREPPRRYFRSQYRSGRAAGGDGRSRAARSCRRGGRGRAAGLGGDQSAAPRARAVPVQGTGQARSEEHTSELQSLMRISYAVFCLKKKKRHKAKNTKQYESVIKANNQVSTQAY